MNKLLAVLLAGVFAATLSIGAFAADDMEAPSAAPAVAAPAADTAKPMHATKMHKAHKTHKAHKKAAATPAAK